MSEPKSVGQELVDRLARFVASLPDPPSESDLSSSSASTSCSHGGDKELRSEERAENAARSHDLLPCPFCGSDLTDWSVVCRNTGEHYEFYVLCDCDCRGPSIVHNHVREGCEKAIKEWNTRAGQVADEPSAAGDGE